MVYVFVCLLLGAVLGIPVGLVKPALFGGGRLRALGTCLVLALVGFVGVGVTAPPKEAPAADGQSVAAPVAPAPVKVVAPPPPLPEAQARLIGIVADYAQAYRAAPNDMAKGATRPARAAAICAALKTEVREWRGTVDDLKSTNEGWGVLEVRVAPNLSLKTWNNEMSDLGDKSLIRPGSPLHLAAMQLRKHQPVIVSGTLYRSDADCFREISFTVNGAMTDPDFLFRFSSVRPAD
jgi:hypothetical protein